MIRRRALAPYLFILVSAVIHVAIALIARFWVARMADYLTRTDTHFASREQLVLTSVTFVISLVFAGFYNWHDSLHARPSAVMAVLTQCVLLWAARPFTMPFVPGTIWLATAALELPLISVGQLLTRTVRKKQSPVVVLVGDPDRVLNAVGRLERTHDWVRVSGVVGLTAPAGLEQIYWGALGTGEVDRRLRLADEVILLGGSPQDMLHLTRLRRAVGFLLVPSPEQMLLGPANLTRLGDLALIEVAAPASYGTGAALKRAADVVVSSVLLLLLLPLMAIIALLILLDSGRPIIISQERRGRNDVAFLLRKFRSMRRLGEDASGKPTFEVTAFGNWLRAHRADEIPQLWNVLRGDMSLVGPRPEMPSIVDRIMTEVPQFDLRLLVRPGLTGLAQVYGDYDTEPSRKLLYDLHYITTWTPAVDIMLILRTIPVAMSGKGS